MADLYGTNAGSSSLESEEMSSFLHNLLHNSINSSNSTSCPSFKDKNKQPLSFPPQAPEATSSSTANLVGHFPIFSDLDTRFRERASAAGSSVVFDSSTGFPFSDPGRGFLVDARDCPRNTFPSVCAGDSDGNTSTLKGKFPVESDFDDFGVDCKGLEASAVPENPGPPRSSKRSRAAEFHNLSEKRRRSRINEKLKALQNLIPNSNKTDKASMLDEAIEYLKQLQLQVQMLSLRNGLGMHPFYLPGSLHAQIPQTGLGFSEGNEVLNTNTGEEAFSGNQEISFQAALDIQNQCTFSKQPNQVLPMTNITNLETTFGLEPSTQNQCGPFSHLTSSKELCREDRLSQLQLDMSCSGKNSSSGVSS